MELDDLDLDIRNRRQQSVHRHLRILRAQTPLSRRLSGKGGTMMRATAAQRFDTFSDAFAVCRDRNAPLRVHVNEPCNDCCRESEGNPKRLHKVYPSGRAVPLMLAAEDCR